MNCLTTEQLVELALALPKEEEADLLAFCRRQLAAYKIPRMMKFVSEAELPLTVTGKLQKNRLAEFFTRGA